MKTSKLSSCFPWAPRYYQALQQKHRDSVASFVPEITYVLYLCSAIRDHVLIEEIAAQANVTYPDDFFTWVDGKKVPDLALIQMVLAEAETDSWRFVVGDWRVGWRLTKKGLRFAKDVDRRKHQLSKSTVH